MAITRSPRNHAPRVPAPAIGTAIRSNNSFIGAAPSRVRAWEIALVDGTVQLLPPVPQKPQPVHELTQHLFVGLTEEQVQRQHVVHHHVRRQQP